MSYSIVDNFNYNGEKPNFERDRFTSLADARRFAQSGGLDVGHPVFIENENRRFEYKGLNENNQAIFEPIVTQSDLNDYVKKSDLRQEGAEDDGTIEVDFNSFVKKEEGKGLSTHDLTDDLYNVLTSLGNNTYPTTTEIEELTNLVNNLKRDLNSLIESLHPSKIVILNGESQNFSITEAANINISWKYAKMDGNGANITSPETTYILLNGVRANSSYTNYINESKVDFSISIPAPRQIKSNVFRIMSDTDEVEFTYNFLAPAYFGTVSDEFRRMTDVNKATEISRLETIQKVDTKEAKVKYRLSLNSIIYAYPAVYGELTSIRNLTVGGVEDINNFSSGTVTINNIEYNYYIVDINFADWMGNLEEGNIVDRSEYLTYKFK